MPSFNKVSILGFCLYVCGYSSVVDPFDARRSLGYTYRVIYNMLYAAYCGNLSLRLPALPLHVVLASVGKALTYLDGLMK